jgi:hypothetical protein
LVTAAYMRALRDTELLQFRIVASQELQATLRTPADRTAFVKGWKPEFESEESLAVWRFIEALVPDQIDDTSLRHARHAAESALVELLV